MPDNFAETLPKGQKWCDRVKFIFAFLRLLFDYEPKNAEFLDIATMFKTIMEDKHCLPGEVMRLVNDKSREMKAIYTSMQEDLLCCLVIACYVCVVEPEPLRLIEFFLRIKKHAA